MRAQSPAGAEASAGADTGPQGPHRPASRRVLSACVHERARPSPAEWNSACGQGSRAGGGLTHDRPRDPLRGPPRPPRRCAFHVPRLPAIPSGQRLGAGPLESPGVRCRVWPLKGRRPFRAWTVLTSGPPESAVPQRCDSPCCEDPGSAELLRPAAGRPSPTRHCQLPAADGVMDSSCVSSFLARM